MSSCLTPTTVTKTYPRTRVPDGPCTMFDEYVPCDDCPDYPNGYPADKCLVVSVNGKCWMAVSMQDDNTSNPNNFIGNTDESKAWLVMEPCDLWKWMINKYSGTPIAQITEDDVLSLIEPLECYIKELGCVLSVPAVENYSVVPAGEWVCVDGCWRQAKIDTAITKDEDGNPSIPGGETDNWGPCKTIFDLLSILDIDIDALAKIDLTQLKVLLSIKQACTGATPTAAMAIITADQVGEGLWWNPDTCKLETVSANIPTGCNGFIEAVSGSYSLCFDDEEPIYTITENAGTPTEGITDVYQAHPAVDVVFSVADYPYLAEAGKKACIQFVMDAHYKLKVSADTIDNIAYQSSMMVILDGNIVKSRGDGYFMNAVGTNENTSDNACICITTTGSDLVFQAFLTVSQQHTLLGAPTPDVQPGDCVEVDMSAITGNFSASSA